MESEIHHALGRIEGKLDAHSQILQVIREEGNELEGRVRHLESDAMRTKTVAVTAATIVSVGVAVLSNAAEWMVKIFK